MIRVVHTGFGFCFLPIPDPGVKKAPNPGSGTLKKYALKNYKSNEVFGFFSCKNTYY
jgi:hypothetical protein